MKSKKSISNGVILSPQDFIPILEISPIELKKLFHNEPLEQDTALPCRFFVDEGRLVYGNSVEGHSSDSRRGTIRVIHEELLETVEFSNEERNATVRDVQTTPCSLGKNDIRVENFLCIQVKYCRDHHDFLMKLNCEFLAPSSYFQLAPIQKMEVEKNDFYREIVDDTALSVKSGYLTVSPSRRVVLVGKDSPQVKRCEVIGIWVKNCMKIFSLEMLILLIRFMIVRDLKKRVHQPSLGTHSFVVAVLGSVPHLSFYRCQVLGKKEGGLRYTVFSCEVKVDLKKEFSNTNLLVRFQRKRKHYTFPPPSLKHNDTSSFNKNGHSTMKPRPTYWRKSSTTTKSKPISNSNSSFRMSRTLHAATEKEKERQILSQSLPITSSEDSSESSHSHSNTPHPTTSQKKKKTHRPRTAPRKFKYRTAQPHPQSHPHPQSPYPYPPPVLFSHRSDQQRRSDISTFQHIVKDQNDSFLRSILLETQKSFASMQERFAQTLERALSAQAAEIASKVEERVRGMEERFGREMGEVRDRVERLGGQLGEDSRGKMKEMKGFISGLVEKYYKKKNGQLEPSNSENLEKEVEEEEEEFVVKDSTGVGREGRSSNHQYSYLLRAGVNSNSPPGGDLRKNSVPTRLREEEDSVTDFDNQFFYSPKRNEEYVATTKGGQEKKGKKRVLEGKKGKGLPPRAPRSEGEDSGSVTSDYGLHLMNLPRIRYDPTSSMGSVSSFSGGSGLDEEEEEESEVKRIVLNVGGVGAGMEELDSLSGSTLGDLDDLDLSSNRKSKGAYFSSIHQRRYLTSHSHSLSKAKAKQKRKEKNKKIDNSE